MTEESLTPGNTLRGAHVQKDTRPDMVKVWFFCLLPVVFVALGVLIHLVTGVEITFN